MEAGGIHLAVRAADKEDEQGPLRRRDEGSARALELEFGAVEPGICIASLQALVERGLDASVKERLTSLTACGKERLASSTPLSAQMCESTVHNVGSEHGPVPAE